MSWLPTKDRQEEIDHAIDQLLQETGLQYPEDTLLDIVKKKGIQVYITDFEDQANEVSGIIKYPNGDEPAIYLNKDNAKTRLTFTLAHELGHFLLHPHNEEKYRVDKYEYPQGSIEASEETEANYFAASLLVPVGRLIQILKETDDVTAIARYFGVSEATIRNRIRWLNQNQ